MSTLTGIEVNASYKNLLQVSNANAGVDATLRDVEDGEGTVSALKLSTLAAKVTGTFEATTSVVTPLVKSASGAFSFGGNNTTEWISNGSLIPVDDNIRSFGSSGSRIASIFTLIIDSGSGSLVLKGAGTTAVTITGANVVTAGNLTLGAGPTLDVASGNLTITPAVVIAAGQLGFPATQNPSADANTLDDYEEGTWTPTVLFNGASVGVTYTTQTGSYTKIGNRVFFEFAITLSSKGSSTGIVAVGGIPFNVGSTVVPPHSVYWANLNSSFVYMIGMPGSAFTDRISILGIAAAAQTVSQALDTDFSNTTQIVGAGVYSV